MTGFSDALHAAAGDTVDLDLDELHHRVARRRRHRGRARAGACLAIAVMAVGGVGLAAGAGGDGGDVRAAEGGFGLDEETTTSETSPSTEATTESSTEPTATTEPPPSTDPSTPTTEMPPPVSTSPPPPTTAPPAPAAVVLEWTYAGTEQYRLFQPECPDLTHWLDAEATGSDGSSWVLREDYCGRNHGDRWEGAGTFSLAGTAGSLSGSMTSAAPMPTTGVPYAFAVEGGTGAYEGATGGCTVTITMSDAVFGSAHHEGTITCDLALGDVPDDTSGAAQEDLVPESV